MLLSVLRKYWGYNSFRSPQREVIEAVLESKKDSLVILKTGTGKSICYQLPILCRSGICVVVSPLIALMQDQVDNLLRRGIMAAYINHSFSENKILEILSLYKEEKIKILYVSPERLESPFFQKQIATVNVAYIAVDEAHCITEWGYDFRYSYLKIKILRRIFPNVKIIALSASATEKVIADIVQNLEFKDYRIFKESVFRSNIFYSVVKCENKYQKLNQLLRCNDESVIIYVNERIKVMQLYLILSSLNFNVSFYHGGLNFNERKNNQTAWINNEKKIIVATNAFGMGIDKANVRNVIHIGLPQTIESYYQESGRAGRDDKPSNAIILFEETDIDELYLKHRLSHYDKKSKKQIFEKIICYLRNKEIFPLSFDIFNFIKQNNFVVRVVFSVLRALEKDEIILFNSQFFNFSSIKFEISQKEMKAFFCNYSDFSRTVLKKLLELYSAELFFLKKNIIEEEIAESLQQTTGTIVKSLKLLANNNIISYDQVEDKRYILGISLDKFTHEYIKRSIDFDVIRAKEAMYRIQEMVYYVNCKYRCRMEMILYYFGEDSDLNCNNCDYCLNKKPFFSKQNSYCDNDGFLPLVIYKEVLSDFMYNRLRSQHDIVDFLSSFDINEVQALLIIDYLLYINKLNMLTSGLYSLV